MDKILKEYILEKSTKRDNPNDIVLVYEPNHAKIIKWEFNLIKG